MGKSIASMTAMERLEHYVDASGDCWGFLGSLDDDGYGRLSYQGKRWQAHRWIWTLLVGPIPEGLVVDHLCRVRHCMNPDHMELVTRAENVMRGYGPPARYARQSHCSKGHPLSGENLYESRGRRYCRACF